MALSVFLFWCTLVGPAAFWQRAVLRGHHENGDLWVTTSIGFRGLFTQLSTPLLGAASDRWGRRLAQALLVAAYSLWLVPLAIAPSAAWCVDLSVVLMALAGLGGSPFYVPFAYCADLTPQREAHRLSEMNARMLAAGFSPAFVLAPILCDLLFRMTSDRGGWCVLLAVSLFNLLFVIGLLPESLGARSSPVTPRSRHRPSLATAGAGAAMTLPQTKLNPCFYFRLFSAGGPAGCHAARILRQLACIVFFLYLAKMTIISCSILFAEERFGWSPQDAGLLLSLWGFVQFVSLSALASAGRCQCQWAHDERVVLWIGTGAALLSMMLFSVTTHGWLLVVAMGVGAVSMVSLTAITGYAGRLVGRSMQGEIQGLMSTVLALTEILGPPLFGALLSWGRSRAAVAWWLPNAPFVVGSFSVIVAMGFTLGLPGAADAVQRCRQLENGIATQAPQG